MSAFTETIDSWERDWNRENDERPLTEFEFQEDEYRRVQAFDHIDEAARLLSEMRDRDLKFAVTSKMRLTIEDHEP